MKRCPTCQRTYPEDAPDFCPNDGMRLVKEPPAGFDPERTVLSSGLRVPAPVLPEPPRTQPPQAPAPPEPTAPPPPHQQSYAADAPAAYPTAPPPPATPAPPPAAPNFAPQGWSPQPPPQPAQPWPNPYPNPAPTTPIAPIAPIAPPYPGGGRSRALAIAALTTGCCAVTIMAMIVLRFGRDFVLGSLLTLAVLGIGFSVAALLLSLQKPARFGGIPLAIAGLATGTAALVYYFTL